MGLKYKVKRVLESPKKFLLIKLHIELRKYYLFPFFAANKKLGFLNKSINVSAMRPTLTTIKSQLLKKLADDNGAQASLKKHVEFLLQGNISVLGYGTVTFKSSKYFWVSDDFHNYSWPNRYFKNIDFLANGKHCDVKVPWEKSRLQLLVPLAIYACISDDSSCSTCIDYCMDIILDWHAKNPLCFSVNWISAMEVAIRAVNILTMFLLLGPSLKAKSSRLIQKILAQHSYYLQKFPEISDIPGNHTLATEMGLFILNLFYMDSPLKRQKLYLKFIAVVKSQFHEHGMHVEHAPIYHRLCLDMLVIGCTFAKLFDIETKELDAFIARGLDVCDALNIGEGMLPQIADNDSGKIFDFRQEPTKFNHLKRYYGYKDEISAKQSLFVYLLESLAKPRKENRLKKLSAVVCKIPPFVTLNQPNYKLIVKAGDIGLHGRASHDHDDNLSFWFSAFGESLFIDPGCAPYTLDMNIRADNISAKHHNVLSINNRERFCGTMGSIFKTVRGAPVADVVAINENFIHAELDHIQASNKVGKFSRMLTVENNKANVQLTIVDSYEAMTTSIQNFTLPLFLSPKIVDLRVDNNKVIATLENLIVEVIFTSNGAIDVNIENYKFYNDYGSSEQAPVIMLQGAGEMDNNKLILVTKIIVQNIQDRLQ